MGLRGEKNNISHARFATWMVPFGTSLKRLEVLRRPPFPEDIAQMLDKEPTTMVVWRISRKTLRKGDGIGLRIEEHGRRKRRRHAGFAGYWLKRTIIHDLFDAGEEGVELFSRLDLILGRDVFEDSPTGTD